MGSGNIISDAIQWGLREASLSSEVRKQRQQLKEMLGFDAVVSRDPFTRDYVVECARCRQRLGISYRDFVLGLEGKSEMRVDHICPDVVAGEMKLPKIDNEGDGN